MNNFDFSIPTKIKFADDAELYVGTFSRSFSKSNQVLVMYGSQRIGETGLYHTIEEKLKEEGLKAIPFGGIVENPVLSDVERAIELVRANQVGLVLAVGGGSVIDSAKAVALGSCYEGRTWDLYMGRAKATSALPVGVVLTMAATASEANGVSVIWNKATNEKKALTDPLMCPSFALLNPRLTLSVPAKNTAAGAIDIFAHAFERYIVKSEEGTLRNALCEAVMNTIKTELPLALENPMDYDHRSQLMWAATVAHSNMVGFHGDYACHALSHVLTSTYNISHGMGLGMLMPAWCRFMLEADSDGIQKLFCKVWPGGIDEFENFIRDAGCPVTFQEAGINDVDIDALVAKAIPEVDGYIGGGYRKLHRDDVKAIFEIMM